MFLDPASAAAAARSGMPAQALLVRRGGNAELRAHVRVDAAAAWLREQAAAAERDAASVAQCAHARHEKLEGQACALRDASARLQVAIIQL
jgi:hypothetical protein